jgi:hypothetical protein
MQHGHATPGLKSHAGQLMLRLAIIVSSVAVIGIIAGLASIPLMIRDPLPVVGPRSPAAFQFQDGDVTTAARLDVDSAKRFVLILITDAEAGAGVPTLAFSMPDHDMPSLAPDVQVISDNQFRAAGSFPMPGRWQISVRHGDTQESFQFILGE